MVLRSSAPFPPVGPSSKHKRHRALWYKVVMKTYRFSVVIEKDEDGYFALCPELQGCYTQGDSLDEALSNIRDAIRLHIQDRIESSEEIPQVEAVTLTSMEVQV